MQCYTCPCCTILSHKIEIRKKKTKSNHPLERLQYRVAHKIENEGDKLREELTDIQKQVPWDHLKEAILPF